jgi:predicted phosphodiesterase
MKLLLLQLSDIHLKNKTDRILSRVARIVDAIKNTAADIDSIICVLNGDIVYSGTNDQYELAAGFLNDLKKQLDENLAPLEAQFIIVPGNHDCNFSEADSVREIIVAEIKKNRGKIEEKALLDICLNPLTNFYNFTSNLPFLRKCDPPKCDPRVLQEISFDIRSQRISFICLNTAILSSIHEAPGTLLYPLRNIPDSNTNAEIVIAVHHHPSNWLEPNVSREFRKRLEKTCDLILTGHEHISDQKRIQRDDSNTEYIEAGVLQDNADEENSSFNALLIDSERARRKILNFTWESKRYLNTNSEDPREYHLWTEFEKNSFRSAENHRINSTFLKFLDDPEITLTHRKKGNLKLSDVYVYPDLKRFNQLGKVKNDSIRGEDIPELIKKKPNLYIVGDDQSGKSALAKRIFHLLHTAGDIPIYLDAASERIRLSTIEQDIEGAYIKCYSQRTLDLYRQCDRAKRVVIIDNYHRLQIPPKERTTFTKALKGYAFRVIFLAHETALTFQDLSESSLNNAGELPFEFHGIRPFSFNQQNRLIEKWLSLDEDAPRDTATFISNLERIRRTMETVFGRNYVPPYPPYLLSILQANESGTDLDLKANTHGYFYELFIKQAIARHNLSSVTMNILTGYLSHIANWLHKHDRNSINETSLRELHTSLHDRFEVHPNFEKQTASLEKTQILIHEDDCYRFRHPYIYYYFLACYFRDHINEPTVISEMETMAKELYRERYANTLLFVSHLTNDKRILELLLNSCDQQYPNTEIACMDDDTSFLNSLKNELSQIEIPDIPISERRRIELDEREDLQNDQIKYEDSHKQEIEDQNTLLGQLNSALKTIQILGQFLKNFPANTEKADKDRIIWACSNLARRLLSSYFSIIRANQKEFVKDLAILISQEKPKTDASSIKKQAINTVVTLSEMVALGTILRLSYALGSNELMNSFDRFFGERKSSFMHLTYTALKLDHHNQTFPSSHILDQIDKLRKNPFGMRILQQIVSRHLFMFPVDYRSRQKVAEHLKLNYKKVRSTKESQQLLGDSKTSR